MASTGQGKTTFLLDLLNRWAEAGERMDFLGTEQEPDELRMKWACLRSGVPSWVAINREWDALENGEMLRERIAEDLAKIDEAYGDQVLFVPDKFITLPKIERAAEEAHRRRRRVLVVDHIDRVETGATESEYLEMKRVVRRLKELARDFNLVLLVASQVNRKGREGDRLAVYRPPQLHHMQGGATKEQEADVVLGLWRPIRQRRRDESAQEYKALLSAARSGSVEPAEFLEPNTMGIICLKHRTNGSAEGKRCLLRLERGQLIDPTDRGATAP
jgi:replicative DNA helicase